MRKAIMATVLVAATIFGTAGVASATSTSRFMRMLHTLQADENAVASAARDYDASATQDACMTFQSDLETLQAMSRPSIINKAAWRHTMRYATLAWQGAQACIDGDYSLSADYSSRSTVE